MRAKYRLEVSTGHSRKPVQGIPTTEMGFGGKEAELVLG